MVGLLGSVNNELEKLWKEAADVLLHHLPRGSDEDHKIPAMVARLRFKPKPS
jgi:hypothetical protein